MSILEALLNEKGTADKLRDLFDTDDLTVSVMGVEIELSPTSVKVGISSHKGIIKDFELEDTFQDFKKEVGEVTRKYAQIVADKYQEKMSKALDEVLDKRRNNLKADLKKILEDM